MEAIEAILIQRALHGVKVEKGSPIPPTYLLAWLNNRHPDWNVAGKTQATVNISYQPTVVQGPDLDLITGVKRQPVIDVAVTPAALPDDADPSDD